MLISFHLGAFAGLVSVRVAFARRRDHGNEAVERVVHQACHRSALPHLGQIAVGVVREVRLRLLERNPADQPVGVVHDQTLPVDLLAGGIEDLRAGEIPRRVIPVPHLRSVIVGQRLAQSRCAVGVGRALAVCERRRRELAAGVVFERRDRFALLHRRDHAVRVARKDQVRLRRGQSDQESTFMTVLMHAIGQRGGEKIAVVVVGECLGLRG